MENRANTQCMCYYYYLGINSDANAQQEDDETYLSTFVFINTYNTFISN